MNKNPTEKPAIKNKPKDGAAMFKKFALILFLFSFSGNVFAAWRCDKVSTENQGDTLNVTMSCTNGVGSPVVLTRPVFRPERKADIKNVLRNVAIEMRDKTLAIQRVSTVQGNVDADLTLSALETDPTV